MDAKFCYNISQKKIITEKNNDSKMNVAFWFRWTYTPPPPALHFLSLTLLPSLPPLRPPHAGTSLAKVMKVLRVYREYGNEDAFFLFLWRSFGCIEASNIAVPQALPFCSVFLYSKIRKGWVGDHWVDRDIFLHVLSVGCNGGVANTECQNM